MDSPLGLISIKTLVFCRETPEFKQIKYGKWSDITQKNARAVVIESASKFT